MKAPLIIANWKLNHSKKSAGEFFKYIKDFFDAHTVSAEIVIAPVATMLDFAHEELKDSPIKVCAQNVFYESFGAYTGEYSCEHLRELNIDYCIVGHSERRRLFGENDEDISKKAKACLKAHITPISCIGESLVERESGLMAEVLKRQVRACADAYDSYEDKELIIAYEPLWAIGSGHAASPQQAQESHALIRTLWEHYRGYEEASHLRIIYGGSVNPHNIKDLLSMPDIAGVLVGNASLQVESFLAIVLSVAS
jgi:triosephosphate isomerase